MIVESATSKDNESFDMVIRKVSALNNDRKNNDALFIYDALKLPDVQIKIELKLFKICFKIIKDF